jgi:hypothetical protein
VVVTGEIAFVRRDTKRKPPKTSVGLRVRVLDPETGELINGAAQVGVSEDKSQGAPISSLATDAAIQAVSLARTEILSRVPIEARIVGAKDEILILHGSKSGMKEGMKLVAVRDAKLAARLRVSRVFPDDSEVRIVKNIAGLRPQDTVRVIFRMPDFPRP